MIFLSSSMIKALNLSKGDEITLSIGLKKRKVRLEKGTYEGNKFFIDKQTLSDFSIDKQIEQPLAFFYNSKDNELKVGPVIGIINQLPITEHGPKLASLYKKILKIAFKIGIICYYFTPESINFNTKTIKGTQLNCSKKSETDFRLIELPMPDIVYLQAGIVSKEQWPVYFKFVQDFILKDKIIKLISGFGLNNKLINHYSLLNFPSVKEYLPETTSCNSADSVFYFLNKYSSVYLKPTSSSRGMGIYKISMKNNNYIVEHHTSKTEKSRIKLHDKNTLYNVVQRIIVEKPYLVQQPVRVIRYKNMPVAFRAHLFKDDRGKWDILCNKAKLGAEHGIITGSGLWGGYEAKSLEVLKEVFNPDDIKVILKRIEECAYKTADVVDQLYPQEYGELGLDIALDEDQKVWLLEINTKPVWGVPRGVDAVKYEEDVATHLFDYSRYLLGLSSSNSIIGHPAELSRTENK